MTPWGGSLRKCVRNKRKKMSSSKELGFFGGCFKTAIHLNDLKNFSHWDITSYLLKEVLCGTNLRPLDKTECSAGVRGRSDGMQWTRLVGWESKVTGVEVEGGLGVRDKKVAGGVGEVVLGSCESLGCWLSVEVW